MFTGLRDGTHCLDTLSVNDFSSQTLVLFTSSPLFEPLLPYTPGIKIKINFQCRFTRTVYFDFRMLQWHRKGRLRRKNPFQIKTKTAVHMCRWTTEVFPVNRPKRTILTWTTRTYLTTEVFRSSHLTTTETVVQLLLLCTQRLNRSFIVVHNNTQRNRTQSAFHDFRFLEFALVPSFDALTYADFST